MLRTLTLGLVASGMIAMSSSASFACACCGSWQVNVPPGDTLNVRTGPGSGYPVIYELPDATTCVVKTKTCNGRWCRISYGDVSGWAHTRYISRFWGN